MNSLLGRLCFKSLRYQPKLLILLMTSIAIGVSLIVGMDIAIQSSNLAFERTTSSLTGKATHQIIGSGQGVSDQVYFEIRKITQNIAPVMKEDVYVVGFGKIPFKLLGVDPFAEAPFRDYFDSQYAKESISIEALLTRKNAVVLSNTLANRFGVRQGSSLSVVVGGRPFQLFVASTIEPRDKINDRFLQDVIVADISVAKELSNRFDTLDQIDVLVDRDDQETLDKIQNVLPKGVQVVLSANRTRTIREMTKAFETNLFALSLLALLVGLFLVWSAMSFSVIRRKSEFSLLRCMGLTSKQIFLMIAFQALLVGLGGALVGVLFGAFMGKFLVLSVSQTMSDLFFVTHVRQASWTFATVLKGITFGVLGSLLAMLLPALEVARIRPREGLSLKTIEVTQYGRIISKCLLVSVFVLLLSAGLLIGQPKSLMASLVAALGVILAFSAIIPLAAWIVVRMLSCIKKLTVLEFAAWRLLHALPRTAIPMAALMVSLATVIGITGMVESFRETVVSWLDQRLVGDVYITVPNQGPSRAPAVLDEKVIAFLKSSSEVSRLEYLRSISVETNLGPSQLVAFENNSFKNPKAFLQSIVPPKEVWKKVLGGDIMISEPLAFRWGIKKAGEAIDLLTPKGWRSFKIAAIYYDYASSQGVIGMSLSNYQELFSDMRVNAVAAILKNSTRSSDISTNSLERLKSIQVLDIKPNRDIRSEVMEIFSRTFSITQSLKWLAVFVAFVGIMSSLLSQTIENIREYGLLRAIGFRRGEISLQIFCESLLMSLIAWVVSVPLGVMLTYIMVYIINYRAFGWTLQMHLDKTLFLHTLLLTILAATLSSIYPSWKTLQLRPMEMLKLDQ
ncbi:MAG: FtsX-like permease family protein [Bdellovibrionales bacterium]|nr:FtsX-like permease family protein [Bdellovibrionales bacterium]